MKVLFVTNMYPIPAYTYMGIHVKEQIEDLVKNKNITADIFFINGYENKVNYFHSIFKIRQKIQNEKYDLLHIHYGISGIFLLFFKPLIPVVITLHSGELFKKKGLINHLLQKYLTLSVIKKTDKIVVLNNEMVSLLNKHDNKLIKLPCGSNLDFFNQKTTAKANNKILIGFPGNKERREKNYPLFSSVINILKQTHDIEIVEFHGLTREDVVNKLNEIDLLLMTSLVEGSPQIIKEAMSCNKPIVSTNVGDVKYLLQNVKNAYVINSFKPEEFIQPIKQIITLPPGQKVSNGRDKLMQLGLDISSVSEKLFSVYNELI